MPDSRLDVVDLPEGFDLDFVRSRFPAFQEPSLAGWAHFENAGGSYPCIHAVDRLAEFYRTAKVQPHAPYPAAQEAGRMMDEGAEALAPWLGVPARALHIGPSTTQNVYVLARAALPLFGPGDALVVTNQDHEANTGAWRRLADEGVEIREWRVDGDGALDPAALETLMADGRVRLVAFPHCSNIVAEINPVQEICPMIREAGAISVVDGVAYAPHALPDIGKKGADVYLFSTYKTFGPHLGVMAMDESLAMRFENQGHYFNGDDPRKRLTPAGPDHAQVAALAGIADYMAELDVRHYEGAEDDCVLRRGRMQALLRSRERALAAPLLDYLSGHAQLRLLGPSEPTRRAPTVSVVVPGMTGAEAAAEMARHGLMCGGGDFYARRLIEALGVDPDSGVLRMSFLHYTAEEEIERLIEGLESLCRARSGRA
ncbi:Selenocysteine lyase/Cysteine desulfurase [Albimonas donghaensis]|uniref:Selenocysteine lyase/Cysteine desulfurase n=1 Tax=Albimonas donghaensis TaxID=356660 RepID=A0A1H2YHU7_9RHOB|nr:aminotransferase class V-fold PLP-dependent enzyme [Albimonas donghaensis]SDX04194.1 Selenocysteine lyase/Cysteine desulfurase [Albimonas donghaensis]